MIAGVFLHHRVIQYIQALVIGSEANLLLALSLCHTVAVISKCWIC